MAWPFFDRLAAACRGESRQGSSLPYQARPALDAFTGARPAASSRGRGLEVARRNIAFDQEPLIVGE